MTPKEKAEELLNNFYQATDGHWNQVPVSKQCALIAVDETLKALHFNVWTNVEEINYWKEVKQHIEQL
jgi:hypothetical protein